VVRDGRKPRRLGIYHHYTETGGEKMPSFPIAEGRRSQRVVLKRPASLVINLDRNQKKLPCLVLDSSKGGFRLRGTFHQRRGQAVELILDHEPFHSVRCRVVWLGKAGSEQEDEVGLEIF